QPRVRDARRRLPGRACARGRARRRDRPVRAARVLLPRPGLDAGAPGLQPHAGAQGRLGQAPAVGSQPEITASTATLLLSEWVPGIRTTVRLEPSGGIPNGSFSPWTTRVGTVTASSSSRRLVSGRPGGWSGKARQITATDAVSAAVRQATRAPAERPPVTSG